MDKYVKLVESAKQEQLDEAVRSKTTDATLVEIRKKAEERFLSKKKPKMLSLYHLPKEFKEHSLDKYLVDVSPAQLKKNIERITKVMEKNNWTLYRKAREDWVEEDRDRSPFATALVFKEVRPETEEEQRDRWSDAIEDAGNQAVAAEKKKRKDQRENEKRIKEREKAKALKAKQKDVLKKLTPAERKILGMK